MDPTTTSFNTKRDAKLYVAEKSVREKKPFKLFRSDSERFEVVCPVDGCAFRLNIRAQKDNHFHITKMNHAHTCCSFTPTITRAWVFSKTLGFMMERPKRTIRESTDSFHRAF